MWLSISFVPILPLPCFPTYYFNTAFSASQNWPYFLQICPISISVSYPPLPIDAPPAHSLWEILPLRTSWDSWVSIYLGNRFWPQTVLLKTILNFFCAFQLVPSRMGSYLQYGVGREQAVHVGSGDQGEEEWSICCEGCKSSSARQCSEQCVCTPVPWSLGRNWGRHFGMTAKFPQAKLYAPQL